MAECTSVAQLTRFVVKISENCASSSITALGSSGIIFSTAIKVSGLGLGEEGTVTVPQWGVNGMLADGQRTLSELNIDFRIEDKITSALAATPAATSPNSVLYKMFANRASSKYDIDIAITNRAFKALFVLKYEKCDFRSLKFEDQELGAAKLGTIMTSFLPYDVKMVACDGTNVVISGRPASSDLSWASNGILC